LAPSRIVEDVLSVTHTHTHTHQEEGWSGRLGGNVLGTNKTQEQNSYIGAL